MNKYSHLSKEELLKIIEKQEKEPELKKYSLVWDREKEPEQAVLDCENNLPILKRIKEKQPKYNFWYNWRNSEQWLIKYPNWKINRNSEYVYEKKKKKKKMIAKI